MFSCILVQKKQTNCEINSYILWLGITNKYGSLNCRFLKLVPYIFLSKNNFHSPSQPQKCWKIVIMQQKVKTIIQLCLIMTKASVLLHFRAKKKQTNCEINSFILWLGIANKYGSLNCRFLKLVLPGFRVQNGKYFPLSQQDT